MVKKRIYTLRLPLRLSQSRRFTGKHYMAALLASKTLNKVHKFDTVSHDGNLACGAAEMPPDRFSPRVAPVLGSCPRLKEIVGFDPVAKWNSPGASGLPHPAVDLENLAQAQENFNRLDTSWCAILTRCGSYLLERSQDQFAFVCGDVLGESVVVIGILKGTAIGALLPGTFA